MDIAFVYSALLKSCYRILFNTKNAMCSDTKPSLVYVKLELFFADNCFHLEIKPFYIILFYDNHFIFLCL
jgi:hypothetical protein